ncbi:hypothetical protein L7F22_043058 [Adiantum nelumboides]|nr:hypothetical protein [Adiantum nelumboides]
MRTPARKSTTAGKATPENLVRFSKGKEKLKSPRNASKLPQPLPKEVHTPNTRASKESCSIAQSKLIPSSVLPNDDKSSTKGKGTSNVAKKELLQAGNSIQSTIGWTDPIDSLSIYTYIARAQANEAIVENKRRCEDDALGPSKWPTRSSPEAQVPPAPEVIMEEAARTKKSSKPRGPFYKLKFDIELGTNFKKVFTERILNSKVELTLGEVLGIAKRKFYEEVIDIIKRKTKVLAEQEAQPVQNQIVEIMESILDAYKEESNEEDDGEVISYAYSSDVKQV